MNLFYKIRFNLIRIRNLFNIFILLLLIIVVSFCFIYWEVLAGKKIFTHDSIIWFGSFYFYIDNIANGSFPFWDPYMLTGTFFYPNIHLLGLLDPSVLLCVFFVKLFKVSILTAYVYFFLLRILIYIIGAFCLFRHITKCNVSAVLAAGVLLFSIAPVCFRQNGLLNSAFLTPFALYFLILFLDNIETNKKHLYLILLVIIIGLSLNIYIPAYFVFNLTSFLIVIIVLKFVSFKKIIGCFRNRAFLTSFCASLVVLILLSSPSAVLKMMDFSKKGELFPSVRIIQKNVMGVQKKFLATDISEDLLSKKFCSDYYVCSSAGNILNLLYPDLWKSYFKRDDLIGRCDFISEAFQYIGIIPFILCAIGFLYGKSRYRFIALVMLLIISANMFSYSGVHFQTYNILQKTFNLVFPFLKTIEVRENFSLFFMLYLCILLSIGFRAIFYFRDVVKQKSSQIIMVCIAIACMKIIATYCLFGKMLFKSINDLFAMAVLAVFPIMLYMNCKEKIKPFIFKGLVLILVAVDLYFYNMSIKEYVLKDNDISQFLDKKAYEVNRKNNLRPLKNPMSTDWPTRSLVETIVSPLDETVEKKAFFNSLNFEYFRQVFADADKNWGEDDLAFKESILRQKGIMPRGTNHIFTTKRYYDLLTHVPLQNQFALSGVIYPIIRFYPLDKVMWGDKNMVLNYCVKSRIELIGEYLFLEKDITADAERHNPKEVFDSQSFEDVLSLHPNYIKMFYDYFMKNNWIEIEYIRNEQLRHLKSSECRVKVKGFSANILELWVENKNDGCLYYNDGWSQYWKAYDNNKRIPVYIADYNSKAVFIKKGKHLLKFIFDPLHYRIAVAGYYAGLILSFIIICILCRSKIMRA